jgi:hypothetical protein
MPTKFNLSFENHPNLSLEPSPNFVLNQNPNMKRLLLLALSMSSLAQAQEDVPRKYVRFIPLGELPVWEEEFVKGVRVQKPPPPGSQPPSTVTYSQGEEAKILRLALRTPTDIAVFPGNAKGIELKAGSGAEGKKFVNSPMPAKPFSLGVLFRDNTAMSWDKPIMVMLSDDAGSFPAGQMRLVNTSDKVVIVQMDGKQPFGIAPGKVSVKPVKVGDTPIKVGYQTADGGNKSIWQNVVKVGNGERVQCFFYKAQGKDPRNAVRFLSFPESLPKVPKPPR